MGRRWDAMTFEDLVEHAYEQFRVCDIEFWLDLGNDVNHRDPRPGPGYPRMGWTLLHYAVRNGHLDVVRFLASRGANLDAQDSAGWTALHLAVDLDFVVATQDGHMPEKLPTAKLLLELGADPAIVNKDGNMARDLLAQFDLGPLFDQVAEEAAVRRLGQRNA